MSQQYGLGRGLASLIPPKKSNQNPSDASPKENNDGEDVREKHSPFNISPVNRFPKDEITVPKNTTKASEASGAKEVSVNNIVPNPHQPRLQFDESKLSELSESIKEHGILQPLVVSSVGDNFELIAGERRLQAAKKAGLETVPVIIRDVTEQEKLELAIIENIQRHNLNPIEEAKAFLRLVNEFNLPQDAVAKKMGKSRSAVANTLRLLHLPVEIQRAVVEGKISEGHAKALLAIENPEKQRAVFDLIIKEELTVRETEQKVRTVAVKPHVRSTTPINAGILERMEHLTELLGTKVKISPSGKGGRVVIEYYSPEDLDGLLKRLEE